MPAYTLEYFRSEVSDFYKMMGLRPNWERLRSGNRRVDIALGAILLVSIHTDAPTPIINSILDVAFREFERRDAAISGLIPFAVPA